ncbi:MAG: hypothetical protein ACUVYA_08285 [Planctomycetota bacterium]
MGYRRWYWGAGDEAIQVQGSTLVFHRYSHPWILWDCLDCGVREGAADALPPRCGRSEHKVYVVDLADPDLPKPVDSDLTPAAGIAWTYEAGLELATVDLSDPRAIRAAGKVEVSADYGYLQAVEGGRGFIGSGPGVFTYDVRDIGNPAFEKSFRREGWSQDIVVSGEGAFVPSGYYGVQVLEL